MTNQPKAELTMTIKTNGTQKVVTAKMIQAVLNKLAQGNPAPLAMSA